MVVASKTFRKREKISYQDNNIVAFIHHLSFPTATTTHDMNAGQHGQAADTAGRRRFFMSARDRNRMPKIPAKPPTTVEEVDLDVLKDTLSFYIRAINLAVSRDLDECLEGLDVAKGTGKITTLLLVDSHPGIRPSVIAHLTMKDRSAMGRIIDQMEAHNLLRRETSPEDSRAQELYITAAGAALAVKVRELVPKQSREFFDFIPEDEQRQLMDILRRAYRRIVGLAE
nr:MarR family winged helix-turn-helix transcriptional regulator [Rhizobium cremeum]